MSDNRVMNQNLNWIKEYARNYARNYFSIQLKSYLTNCTSIILVGIGWKLAGFLPMGDNRGIADVDTNCELKNGYFTTILPY